MNLPVFEVTDFLAEVKMTFSRLTSTLVTFFIVAIELSFFAY